MKSKLYPLKIENTGLTNLQNRKESIFSQFVCYDQHSQRG